VVSLKSWPIYSSTHWIRGWEGHTAGLNILETLEGIEQSLGTPAGSLVTIPTDLPGPGSGQRLRIQDMRVHIPDRTSATVVRGSVLITSYSSANV
jgi:hypothetical protein